jgi:uncharacterized membrane protein YkvA (DUF1232 family)
VTAPRSSSLADALVARASADEIEAALRSAAPDLRTDELQELAPVLTDYLNTLPAAVAALSALAKDRQLGRGAAFAAGSVLLYVVDEDDLLPESEFGALGLLDDAYLTHRCVAALTAAFPQLGSSDGYVAPVAHATATVRALLPDGVADALDRTGENLARAGALFFAGSGADAAGPASGQGRPPLRVGDALETLRQTR